MNSVSKNALLLRCRSLEFVAVSPITSEYKLLVMILIDVKVDGAREKSFRPVLLNVKIFI